MQLNKTMDENGRQKLIAFICGDCSAMIFSLFGGIIYDIGHFGLKVVATIILGAAGGLAGLVTKDCYNKWKARRKNKSNPI